jgi:acetyl-CoA decarbonylase/synthase complex subunit delta
MERIRIGALTGDKMLSMPVICAIGYEAARAKEANAGVDQFPGWGDLAERAVLWEAMTSAAFLQAGGHIFVLRHPRSVALVKQSIGQLMIK